MVERFSDMMRVEELPGSDEEQAVDFMGQQLLSKVKSVKGQTIELNQMKDVEPIVKLKVSFEEENLFKGTYYKNQRNSLRCFPCCSIEQHQKNKFCGRPLRIALTIRRNLELAKPFSLQDMHLVGGFTSLVEVVSLDPRSRFIGEIERELPEVIEGNNVDFTCVVVFNSNCRAWKMPSHALDPNQVFCVSVFLPLNMLDPNRIRPRHGKTHLEVSAFCSPVFEVKWFRQESELTSTIEQQNALDMFYIGQNSLGREKPELDGENPSKKAKQVSDEQSSHI